MQLTTRLPQHDILAIARAVARDAYAGNLVLDVSHLRRSRDGRDVYRVKLGALYSGEIGARRSWSGRRGRWSCWHVFRDVFAAWLAADPDAIIRTGMATYRGAAGFLDDFPSTAYRNVGSMAAPAYMPELCDCQGDDDGGRYVDALAEIRAGVTR